ncbi:hypothetical protein K438DRAFT_958027 [Mycena galopus ATCC 62051]|nr:hypothetical protein K438DRAFT_958027 [Mycena galopus ATCC 62051]
MPSPQSPASGTGPIIPRPSHTFIQYISGGIGGTGGAGPLGGGGGTGEGPSILNHFSGIHIHSPGSEQQEQINATERKKIIEWLSPINFFLRQADISQSRQQGTGEWLLTDPDFQQWVVGSGKTLWCHGIRG